MKVWNIANIRRRNKKLIRIIGTNTTRKTITNAFLRK